MVQHYSTKDFFRQMPNRLLARYFEGRGVLGEVDFATLKEARPDGLFAAWLELSDGTVASARLDLGREVATSIADLRHICP